jgi:polysaccharide pyruvyl transferase WcaK-like protein
MRATGDRPPRVALLGEFGRGNFGNDASLLAAVAELRAHDPDVDILCLCNAPEMVVRRYGLAATAIRRQTEQERSGKHSLVVRVFRRWLDVVRMYKLMRQRDLVLVPGMGVLEARSMRAGAFASMLFMTTLAARAAGSRVAFVSVGADAAYRRSTRALLRWTLKLADYCSFRDAYSRRCAQGFGLRSGSYPVYPDLVFAVDPPIEPVTQVKSGSVGIGLINYKGAFYGDDPARRDATAAEYLDSVTSFAEWLLGRGHDVTLLTGDRKDEDAAEAVRERIDFHSTGSLHVARSESLEDLIQHMRRLDHLVVSRYHNVIAAALIAKPVISINYLPKNGELMADMGLGKFHQPLEQLDEQYLREQFIELERSSGQIAGLMAAKRREYRDRVEQQWAVLKSTILPPARTIETTRSLRTLG